MSYCNLGRGRGLLGKNSEAEIDAKVARTQ
jgi:hypothetical protein